MECNPGNGVCAQVMRSNRPNGRANEPAVSEAEQASQSDLLTGGGGAVSQVLQEYHTLELPKYIFLAWHVT